MLNKAAPDNMGIIGIELVPGLQKADITRRLARSIGQSKTLRAAIAYWTLPPTFVSPQLPALLSTRDSFLCVDIHLPTDLQQLEALAERGAHVRLHLRELGVRTEIHNLRLPPHLLHSKLLLFDMPDGTAEIWSGSHNWTHRALIGPNVEASIVLTVKQKSAIYQATRKALQMMYELCTPFDSSDLQQYRQLQGIPAEQVRFVIELHAKSVSDLVPSVIGLFGTDLADTLDIPANGEEVILQITLTSRRQQTCCYQAIVLHTGLLKSADLLADIQLSERRFALRQEQAIPELEPRASLDDVLQTAKYFLTLDVQRKLPKTVQIVDLPARGSFWKRVVDDPLLDRMLAPRRRKLARKRKAPMKVPIFTQKGGTEPGHKKQPSIDKSVKASGRKLVVRRLVLGAEEDDA